MGPAPSLATYQAAANSIYAPQEAADITTQQATTAADISNLESEKGQVGTDYESGIENLQNSVQDETGKISQLYNTRLLGNISGLQGNDMGQMYARANQQQETLEETRANKLSSIATAETNTQNEGDAAISALQSKYQGEEANYAESAYSKAITDAENQDYKNAELGISEARLGVSESNAANSATNNYLNSFKSTAKKGGGFSYVGPNGEALDLGQYALAISQGNKDNALSVITNQLQQSGTSYDKAALKSIGGLQKQGLDSGTILSRLESQYNIDFGGSI